MELARVYKKEFIPDLDFYASCLKVGDMVQTVMMQNQLFNIS